MTIHKKLSLTLGIIIIVCAAGIAVWQNRQSSESDYASSANTAVVSAATSTGSYTLADVAQHSTATSCWTAINGNVYDVTSWINQHPGGPEHIIALCGTDGSAAFNGQHGGEARPAAELATFKIGTLAQ